ncbi:hypothetical protein HY346_00980 [Candidatus Microgenomates bacterium]|nr:hypothetical protein [Candidatus Microgenomates bacterium]
MKLTVKKGVTSKRLAIFIQNSSVTTGAGLTGLVFNSAGLSWYYWREDEGNVGATAVTLVTATRGTFASGGFIEKDATNLPGFYEIGVPNAALATGANWVVMQLKGATNMAQLTLEVELVDYDPQDGVRLGLTALPNAAAEAAGGLYTRGAGAGQINQDANGRVDTRVISNTDKTGYSIGVGGIAATAFAAGAIDAAAIAANAIGASEIADGAIDALTFAAGAIDAAAIATGAIDADAIAADAIGSSELAASAAQEIADEILNRNIAGGGSGGARIVRDALRALRNRSAIAVGTLTVYQEDDLTSAWTAVVTTTAGDPISQVDPA